MAGLELHLPREAGTRSLRGKDGARLLRRKSICNDGEPGVSFQETTARECFDRPAQIEYIALKGSHGVGWGQTSNFTHRREHAQSGAPDVCSLQGCQLPGRFVDFGQLKFSEVEDE